MRHWRFGLVLAFLAAMALSVTYQGALYAQGNNGGGNDPNNGQGGGNNGNNGNPSGGNGTPGDPGVPGGGPGNPGGGEGGGVPGGVPGGGGGDPGVPGGDPNDGDRPDDQGSARLMPFNYAVFGDELARLAGNGYTDSYDPAQGPYDPETAGDNGDVRSNASIVVGGGAVVNGDAISGGAVTINGPNARVTGAVLENQAMEPLVSVAAIVAAAASDNDNASIGATANGNNPIQNGALVLSGQDSLTIGPGRFHFTGVQVTGQAALRTSGAVTIYTDGPIRFPGTSLVNPSQDPRNLVLVTSTPGNGYDVVIPSGTAFYGLVYAPRGRIDVGGSANVFGSLVGREVKVDGNARVHYFEGAANTAIAVDTSMGGEKSFGDDEDEPENGAGEPGAGENPADPAGHE